MADQNKRDDGKKAVDGKTREKRPLTSVRNVDRSVRPRTGLDSGEVDGDMFRFSVSNAVQDIEKMQVLYDRLQGNATRSKNAFEHAMERYNEVVNEKLRIERQLAETKNNFEKDLSKTIKELNAAWAAHGRTKASLDDLTVTLTSVRREKDQLRRELDELKVFVGSREEDVAESAGPSNEGFILPDDDVGDGGAA